MTGAIAGTAILHVPKERESGLQIVTLTVNNSCNLSCDHCYLQYNGVKSSLSKEHARKVLESDFRCLAIVGKEPTLNPEIVDYIVGENSKIGRNTSIITNGILLPNLSQKTLSSLDYIDVSFDGGPNTYSQRRKIDFNSTIQKIKQARNRGARSINALHTIYSENSKYLDDMMEIEDFFDFDTIAFSLFKVPHNHGNVRVTSASLVDQVLPTMANNYRFMNSEHAKLLVSSIDLPFGTYDDFFKRLKSLGLSHKVNYCDNPLDFGFVRVTYDGRVLTPHDAIHPKIYQKTGYSLDDSRFNSLNDIFTQLQHDKDTAIELVH